MERGGHNSFVSEESSCRLSVTPWIIKGHLKAYVYNYIPPSGSEGTYSYISGLWLVFVYVAVINFEAAVWKMTDDEKLGIYSTLVMCVMKGNFSLLYITSS